MFRAQDGVLWVKICCIASAHEADLAIAAGASALGLVSAMPSGPGVISEATIARIAGHVAPPTHTFLLTSLRDAAAIAAQHARLGTTTIQLVDHLEPAIHAELRLRLPRVRLVQVVHVTGEESLAYAERVASGVDALLLDSGNTALPIKELGGTGRTHDWSVSRRIRAAVEIPVLLAGGLNADNVRDAIEAVQPHAVDVCSGVRTNGALDAEKLARFIGGVARSFH